MLTVVVGTPNTTTPEAGLPEEPAAITMWGVTAASEAGDTNVGAWTSFDPKTIIQLRIQLLKKSSRIDKEIIHTIIQRKFVCLICKRIFVTCHALFVDYNASISQRGIVKILQCLVLK